MPGPFDRLTDDQLRRIATVAGHAAHRVETALDMTDHKATLAHPCPDCSGERVIEAAAGHGRWCGADDADAPGAHPKRSQLPHSRCADSGSAAAGLKP